MLLVAASLCHRHRHCPAPAAGVPAPVTPKHPELLHANASWADVPPRTDDYAWLRDDARNDSAVLSHLQEESAYADAVLAPSKGLQARLLAEMKGRLPREEASVPQRRGRHWCAQPLPAVRCCLVRCCRALKSTPLAVLRLAMRELLLTSSACRCCCPARLPCWQVLYGAWGGQPVRPHLPAPSGRPRSRAHGA